MPYPLYLTGIYEDTYEKIKYKLQKEEEAKSKFPPLFFAINLHSFFVTSPPPPPSPPPHTPSLPQSQLTCFLMMSRAVQTEQDPQFQSLYYQMR